MGQYNYKAIDEKGKIIRGKMHASNELELEQHIGNLAQDLISCKEDKPRGFRLSKNKLDRRELINMVFQLEQLTKSGVPLLDGLNDLRDSAPEGYYRDVLTSLANSIEGGKTFSESLGEFSKDFDNVFVSLISVGEESGELPRILKDMTETLRWVDELISATVKILIYPAIVGFVVLSVTAFLMIYLVPQIIPFVNEMGGEIPLHTKALIAVSEFFVDYWWLIFSMPIILSAVLKSFAKKSYRVRYMLDKLSLSFPLLGAINFKIKIARLSNYMALLYSSGITILRSLEICKDLMDNVVLEEAIDNIKNYISEGSSISDSFQRAQLFPPLVVRMVKVGENTGNLNESLLNVSYFFNREVQEAIDKIEPAISPILTVVMGSLLGWIMLSVLGPVWDAVGSIGA